MPPKIKFKSVTNAKHNEGTAISPVVSQNRNVSNFISDAQVSHRTGITPQNKFKSVTNFIQNDNTSIPVIISQNRSALGPPSVKHCTGITPETKFKSMTNFMQNDGVSILTSISQNRSVLGPPSEMHSQTRSKRATYAMDNNNGAPIPILGSPNGRAPSTSGALVKKRHSGLAHQQHTPRVAINRLENMEESPTDDGEHEHELYPSDGLNEHSDDVYESNSSHVQAASTSIQACRKTRGMTQPQSLKPPKGQKWTCRFIGSQLVGEPALKLAGTLGVYARNESYFFPYKKWKQQSMHSFNDVMKEIMVDFEFVDEEGMPANMDVVNKFCLTSLQLKLKDWRHELKQKGYMEGENEELCVKPTEKRVTQETWDSLVQYWGTDEKIREANRNKRNRAEDQTTHTLGAKSIARHYQEQREKLGDDYTTVGAYIKAHQIKSGDYPNQCTKSLCEKVVEVCQEKDLMSSSEPSVLSPILDDLCNGHHGGYERGHGLGWSRRSHLGDIRIHASNDKINQLTIQLQNAKAEIEVLQARDREREEARQAREREMQARMERMEAMLSMHFSNNSVGDSRSHDGLPNNP